MYSLLGLNLILVTRYFHSANRELREFIAAAEQIGTNRTLVVYRPRLYRPRSIRRIVDYLAHAGAYYCMDSHNIDLRNYEAETAPWPIRFRAGYTQRWGYDLSTYYQENAVDMVLVWDAEAGLPATLSDSYGKVYSRGRLQAFLHK